MHRQIGFLRVGTLLASIIATTALVSAGVTSGAMAQGGQPSASPVPACVAALAQGPGTSPGPSSSPVVLGLEGRFATTSPAAGADIFTLEFDSSLLNVYMTTSTQPIRLVYNGIYEVSDGHTLVYCDPYSTITYDYSLDGDLLTMHMVSDTLQTPDELSIQASIFEPGSFTRVP